MKTSRDPEFCKVATVLDAPQVYRLASRLRDELIHVEVISISALQWDVLVPSVELERATTLLKASELSDAELKFIATGKLGNEASGAGES